MQRVDLGGWWQRLIGGQLIDYVHVPGSYPPAGQCTLMRQFRLDRMPSDGCRSFLVTEGVLANATFSLNGRQLGVAGPWTTYRMEIPPDLLREDNEIQADVRDMIESFGPMPGRRFDGGLVRDLYIEHRPQTFLADFAFRQELDDEFSAADCTVEIELDAPERLTAEVVLVELPSRQVVARAAAASDRPARFHIERPNLWSPERPDLYELTVRLPDGDCLTERVGFRRIDVRGQDFYLNGWRLLLKGVCRHEFNSRDGYSPSEAEIRRELARIRHAGFNYVRLVHSPQASSVCRIAAELGLLVSEEPGTCFHDLSDEAVYLPALECLRRTVKRDRNVPSILAWLIYNECNPNAAYAVKAAAVCRRLDPACRLSFADCSGRDDEIKAMVAAADLTYHGINTYSVAPGQYTERMKVFADRPLVFTEWGGCLGQGNPRILRALCDNFALHTRPEQAERIAGCCFWVWQDYEERSRPSAGGGLPASVDGWTIEGLVERDGTAKNDLLTLSTMCFDMDHPPVPVPPKVEVLCVAPQRERPWQPVPLEGVGGDQTALEAAVDEARRHHEALSQTNPSPHAQQPPRLGRLLVDGIDFACRDVAVPGHPLMIGPGREELIIPVNCRVAGLAFLGQVAWSGGYPSSNMFSVHHRDAEPPCELGTPAAEYVLDFEDGQMTVPLRHGLEILRANDISRWWTPQPRSPYTRPGVRVIVNPSYEVFRLDVWEIPLQRPGMLRQIRWRLAGPPAVLLLAAVSVLPVDR